MPYFDFHHHDWSKKNGIYNLSFKDSLPKSYFSAGVHPNEIEEGLEEKLDWLKEISKHENCVAIGECGLDGIINTDEKLQQYAFEKQIEIANHLQKPMIIHCVRRFSEIIHFQKKTKVPMIIHGFNKKETIGRDLLNHQFLLSFGKSILQNVPLQEFLKSLPDDRFFIETDNSEFNIEEIYQKVAEIKNLNIEEIKLIIEKNLQKLKILD